MEQTFFFRTSSSLLFRSIFPVTHREKTACTIGIGSAKKVYEVRLQETNISEVTFWCLVFRFEITPLINRLATGSDISLSRRLGYVRLGFLCSARLGERETQKVENLISNNSAGESLLRSL